MNIVNNIKFLEKLWSYDKVRTKDVVANLNFAIPKKMKIEGDRYAQTDACLRLFAITGHVYSADIQVTTLLMKTRMIPFVHYRSRRIFK